MAENQYQQNRVTTSGCTLFDENSIMLRLGFLDDGFTILFGDPKQDGMNKTYPLEKRHSLILRPERATALLENIIVDKVLPAMENGTSYNGGVFLNRRKDSILEVRVQDGEVYLAFHKGIDENRVPKESYVFHFQKTQIIENYNPDGSAFEQFDVHGCFMLFCKFLESGVYDINNSSAHSMRKANYYTTNKIFRYLEGLATKLGVTVENRSYQNGSSSGFSQSPEGIQSSQDIMPIPTDNAATSLEGLVS